MRLLSYSVLLFFMFPWVSFGILRLDTQPWFIIAGFCYFLLNLNRKAEAFVYLPFFLFFCSLVVALSYGLFDMLTARAVMGYLAFSVVIYSFYFIKRDYASIVPKVIIASNIVWLVVGVGQILFGENVFSYIVHVRTTTGRGVTGLAPEPTFYGIFLFYLSWLLILEGEAINNNLKKSLIFINLLFVFFVAKSSMVILFIALAFSIYMIFTFGSIKRLLTVILVGCVGLILLSSFWWVLEGTRVAKLFELFMLGPKYIIYQDASVNERVAHIYLSISSSINNFLVPQGYHGFKSVVDHAFTETNGFFWWFGEDDKVMSGVGAIVFELGWFSVAFFLTCILGIFKKHNAKMSFCALTVFVMVFFSAITISFPLVGMTLVSLHFYFKRKDNEDYISYREYR